MSEHVDFYDSIQKGGLVLCANQRLGRALREAFDQWMASQGHTVWPTPEIYEVRQWALRTLNELQPGTPILSHCQSRHLWEDCIRETESAALLGLLQLPATAKTAQQAYTLLLEYDGKLDGKLLSPDQQAFCRWRKLYQSRLRDEGWLDPAEVMVRLNTVLSSGSSSARTVWLAGFDDLPPILNQLIATLQKTGCSVHTLEPPSLSAEISIARFEDRGAEIRAAAQWARREATDVDRTVAVVVSDPAYLSQVERVFREEIDPLSLVTPSEVEERFDFSQGGTLGDEGPIYAALQLLGIEGGVDLDHWSWLLRTPYVNSDRDAQRRIRLDRFVRQQASGTLTVSQFIRLLKSAPKALHCPVLMETLQTLDATPGNTKTAAEWVVAFDEEMKLWGWPGRRSPSSREYQAIKAWRDKVLPLMASLQVFGRALTRSEAVAALRTLAFETSFQVETPRSPIRILGLLEAGGLQFDAVWVLGATETQFPAAPRPNPFIPLPLQVEAGMPHSSHERETDYAIKILKRLSTAASQVTFSLPDSIQGDPQRPSPLLELICPHIEAVNDPTLDAALIAQYRNQPKATWSHEESAPSLSEVTEVRGGTGVLKDQALCPFRAYAHYRIGVRGLEAKPTGLVMTLRGSLLHRLLELFWDGCRTHRQLCTYEDTQLVEQIKTITDQVMQEYEGPLQVQSPTTVELERQRLIEVGVQWLQWEKSRSPFQVEQTESRHELTLDRLKLKTTLDRLDRLEEGGQTLLIDYKTGKSRSANLSPDELQEPQLPLYTRTLSPPPQGVALAQVRRNQHRFVGVCASSHWLPGVSGLDQDKGQKAFGTDDWQVLLQRWSETIDRLATAFCDGDARVDPVDGDKTCEWCDLKPLCRVKEQSEAPL